MVRAWYDATGRGASAAAAPTPGTVFLLPPSASWNPLAPPVSVARADRVGLEALTTASGTDALLPSDSDGFTRGTGEAKTAWNANNVKECRPCPRTEMSLMNPAGSIVRFR